MNGRTLLNRLFFPVVYRHDCATWIEHRHQQNVPNLNDIFLQATKLANRDTVRINTLRRFGLRLWPRSQVQSLHTSSVPLPSMSCHVRGDPNRMPPYPSPLTAASLVSKDPGDITSSGVRSSEFGSPRRSLSTMLISIGHHQLCKGVRKGCEKAKAYPRMTAAVVIRLARRLDWLSSN